MERFTITFLITTFLISLIAALASTWAIRQLSIKKGWGTLPDARMVHKGFIPGMGGVGIYTGFIAGIIITVLFVPTFFTLLKPFLPFVIATVVILFTGIVDDLKTISAGQKLIGQIVAASIVIYFDCRIESILIPFGPAIDLGYFSIPFTFIWIISVINAINLMDGLDGLAGGISLIASIVFAIAAWYIGNAPIFIISISLAAGLFGFLRFNVHPATIFMGDTGALFLGLALSVLSLKVFQNPEGQISMLTAIVTLALPLGDTVISFLRRLNKGNHPFKADKDHLHHRLIYLGLSHRDAVLILNFLAFSFALAAVFNILNEKFWAVLVFLTTLLFSLAGLVRLGYLEAIRNKTLYGDQETYRVASNPAPILVERLIHKVLLFFTDILMFNLALIVFVSIKFHFKLTSSTLLTLSEVLDPLNLVIVTIPWLVLFFLNNLYSMSWDVSRFDKVRRVSKTLIFGLLVIYFITIDFTDLLSESRAALVLYGLLLILFVNTGRLVLITLEKRYKLFDYAPQATLLVGASEKARKILKDIRKNSHLLYDVKGFVTREEHSAPFSDLKWLGTYNSISEIVRTMGIKEIIFAANERSRDAVLELVASLDNMKVVFKIVPEFYDVVSGHKTEEIIGHPLIRLFPDHMHRWQWLLKRLFDILFSLFFLILLLPFGIIIYILLIITGSGKGIVIENYVGKNGRIYGMLNFAVDEETAWLPKLLLDSNLYKIPELINILLGKMSVVGPRPERPKKVMKLKDKIRFYNRRFQVKPGLTGWAQVKYRYDSTLKTQKELHKQDLFYLENMSLKFDLRIITRSIYLFFLGRGKKQV